MKPPRDGGPAFPVAEIRAGEIGVKPAEDGMSLRDYFAAQALPALLANVHTTQVANIRNGVSAKAAEAETDRALRMVASACYGIADDMLAERTKAKP